MHIVLKILCTILKIAQTGVLRSWRMANKVNYSDFHLNSTGYMHVNVSGLWNVYSQVTFFKSKLTRYSLYLISSANKGSFRMEQRQILSTCETGPVGLEAPEPLAQNALYDMHSCSLSAIARLDAGCRLAIEYSTQPKLDTGITVFYDTGATFFGIIRIGN